MNKYILLFLIITLFVLFFIFNNLKYILKYIFFNIIQNINIKSFKYRKPYFIKNFNSIIQPYYKGNIDRNTRENIKININRNIKNEYSILSNELTKDILNDLSKKNIDKNTINILLKRLLPFIHLNGKNINLEELFYIDIINVSGNYYKTFHTDIEWNLFCNNHGFQIWILLEEDDKIKPRGNMFLLETDITEAGKTLDFNENNITITENGSNFNKKIEKKFNHLSEINPKFYYLDAKIGEVFIMNPSLFHCSDPIVENSSRKALNLRIIYKNNDLLKTCNNNLYSKINNTVTGFSCYNNYCYLKETNKNLINIYN